MTRPDHDAALAEIGEEKERLEEEKEKIERGEIDPAWPTSGIAFGILGVVNLILAGYMFTMFSGADLVVSVTMGVSGIAFLSQALWIHKHFEHNPVPTYD